jgi:hypothetical protein
LGRGGQHDHSEMQKEEVGTQSSAEESGCLTN